MTPLTLQAATGPRATRATAAGRSLRGDRDGQRERLDPDRAPVEPEPELPAAGRGHDEHGIQPRGRLPKTEKAGPGHIDGPEPAVTHTGARLLSEGRVVGAHDGDEPLKPRVR